MWRERSLPLQTSTTLEPQRVTPTLKRTVQVKIQVHNWTRQLSQISASINNGRSIVGRECSQHADSQCLTATFSNAPNELEGWKNWPTSKIPQPPKRYRRVGMNIGHHVLQLDQSCLLGCTTNLVLQKESWNLLKEETDVLHVEENLKAEECGTGQESFWIMYSLSVYETTILSEH